MIQVLPKTHPPTHKRRSAANLEALLLLISHQKATPFHFIHVDVYQCDASRNQHMKVVILHNGRDHSLFCSPPPGAINMLPVFVVSLISTCQGTVSVHAAIYSSEDFWPCQHGTWCFYALWNISWQEKAAVNIMAEEFCHYSAICDRKTSSHVRYRYSRRVHGTSTNVDDRWESEITIMKDRVNASCKISSSSSWKSMSALNTLELAAPWDGVTIADEGKGRRRCKIERLTAY